MLRQRQPREENEPHRRFVASLGCVVCGGQSQAAHIRYADLSIGKPSTGMQQKADDKFTVPLCPAHHTSQHDWGNEQDWWLRLGVDPIKLGLALFAVSGDEVRGLQILHSCREQRAA